MIFLFLIKIELLRIPFLVSNLGELMNGSQ